MKTNRMTEVRPAPTRCAVCPVREKALFQVINDEYLHEAESRRIGQYKLSARSHLFEEGAPSTMAYTLFSGWLMLYRSDSEGARQGLRVALPGDFVGYVALNDGVYSHGAMAVTDAVVCGFRQTDLHAMLDRDAKMARHITGIQARYLAGHSLVPPVGELGYSRMLSSTRSSSARSARPQARKKRCQCRVL